MLWWARCSAVSDDAGPRNATKLAVLLDALYGVVLSSGERTSLAWLAGFDVSTVEHIAAVITRARRTGVRRVASSHLSTEVSAPG